MRGHPSSDDRQWLRDRWLAAIDAAALPKVGPERSVASALHSYMSPGPEGGWCNPSLKNLAWRAGRAKSTTVVAIAALVDAGFLVCWQGGGAGRSSEYQATLPERVRPADSSKRQKSPGGAPKGSGERRETVRPTDPNRSEQREQMAPGDVFAPGAGPKTEWGQRWEAARHAADSRRAESA